MIPYVYNGNLHHLLNNAEIVEEFGLDPRAIKNYQIV